MYLVERSNNAIKVNNDLVNGQHADIHITSHGSDFYWAWTAVFAVATLAFFAWTHTLTAGRRPFHQTATFVALVMCITYFTMASNLGWVGIDVEWHHSRAQTAGNTRQIFWVRYIGWFLALPLTVTNLYWTAGLSWASLLSPAMFIWVFVVGRLVGALVGTSYKWGYFVFSLLSLFFILFSLLHPVRTSARALGEDVHTAFLGPSGAQALIWLLYPIAWGVSEGGNLVAPDSEAAFYGVLDFFALLVLPTWGLWGLRSIDPARLGAGSLVSEKRAEGSAAV